MFDEYKKHLEKLGDNADKTFSRVAKKGANHFVKTAQEKTNYYKLVDTGNYRRNWSAEATKKDDVHRINVFNNVEYASHLEYGHKLRNGKNWKGYFVGRMSLDETEGYTILELRKEIKALMMSKDLGVSRGEAMNSLNS